MAREKFDPDRADRERFLKGLKARHLSSEPVVDSGMSFSMSDITDHYFPDGIYPPRQQMLGKLNFFGGIFQKISQEKVPTRNTDPYPISFQMTVDSLLPLLGKPSTPAIICS